MAPNSNYYKYFDNELTQAPNISDSVIIGPYIIFDQIISDMKIDTLVLDIFKDASKIIDLAYYFIIEESSAVTCFIDYGYTHLIYSDSLFSLNF